MPEAGAFLSYVRADDAHDDGFIAALAGRLADEVHIQTGRPFEIFLDRNSIAWGQQWERRLRSGINAATVLLPVITPSYFESPACRQELEHFRLHEIELARDELILPIYYVNTPELSGESTRSSDELVALLASRQYADWREYRFEALTSATVRRALAQMAQRIANVINSVAAPSQRSMPRLSTPAKEPMTETTESERRPNHHDLSSNVKTDVPTLVVDPWGRGDYESIGSAIVAAPAGSRILVRSGLYREPIVIDKVLELIGDGSSEVVLRAQEGNALAFRANMGRVSGFSLATEDEDFYSVRVAQGRLELDDCRIIGGPQVPALAIRGGADPRVRRCEVVGPKAGGSIENAAMFCFDGALGTYEDCDFAGGERGIYIGDRANVVLRRNVIRHNRRSGIVISQDGSAILEENEISDNGRAGVLVVSGHAVIRNNRINRNGYEGIWVRSGASATIEDNDLTMNERGPFDIEKNAQVRTIGNREK